MRALKFEDAKKKAIAKAPAFVVANSTGGYRVVIERPKHVSEYWSASPIYCNRCSSVAATIITTKHFLDEPVCEDCAAVLKADGQFRGQKELSNKVTFHPVITVERLADMAVINSKQMPTVINDGGHRKRWVGIGWVDEGELLGDETLVFRGTPR